MTIPTLITDLSGTAANNSPAGTDAIGSTPDNFIRAMYGIMRRDLASQGADIASAASINLAVPGVYHNITGTATITSLGTVAAGIWKILRFSNNLTLTYNATSLILPAAASIVTSNNDVAVFISLGSGNWFCVNYSTASGTSIVSTRFSGEVVKYLGTTEPTGFVFPYGQTVSRTGTYANLFAAIGTIGGVGDGSTTFTLPDLRGRSVIGRDDMGGSAANKMIVGISGITGTTLGAVGGNQDYAAHSHTMTPTVDSHTHVGYIGFITSCGQIQGNSGGHYFTYGYVVGTNSSAHNLSASLSSNSTTGTSRNVQPTMIQNYLIKV